MREPTKLFLSERVKTTADRFAAAGRESIRRVHLAKPAQRARQI
jgi:hypothetical protein